MLEDCISIQDTPSASVDNEKVVQPFPTPLFKDDNNISIESSTKEHNDHNAADNLKPSSFEIEQPVTNENKLLSSH